MLNKDPNRDLSVVTIEKLNEFAMLINTNDVANYINQHEKEYNRFLEEKEKRKTNKK